MIRLAEFHAFKARAGHCQVPDGEVDRRFRGRFEDVLSRRILPISEMSFGELCHLFPHVDGKPSVNSWRYLFDEGGLNQNSDDQLASRGHGGGWGALSVAEENRNGKENWKHGHCTIDDNWE